MNTILSGQGSLHMTQVGRHMPYDSAVDGEVRAPDEASSNVVGAQMEKFCRRYCGKVPCNLPCSRRDELH